MVSRRFLAVVSIITTAAAFFLLGVFHERTDDLAVRANYDAKLDALRAELRTQLGKARTAEVVPASTMGDSSDGPSRDTTTVRERMIADIKRELQSEMGLLPLALLRDRRTSFVELYSTDNFGKTNYGTAGYLGDGYFVTVKHAVVALKDGDKSSTRKIVGIKILHEGKEVPAKLVDAGDAEVEVHTGDWAIIKTAPIDVPALKPNPSFPYDFAEPIFRLGNDYSKGIILSTGNIGQRTANNLVTCLTDGHPGVSGGGVLNGEGQLVGIPIGRMQGDYRFSFILPLRGEMFRKVAFVNQDLGL
jgi:S1-C subfamily serine protease